MLGRDARSGRGGRRGERGAALLTAIVAISVLTALAVDLAYENRVRLQIAANGRDSLRAEALAQSGVALSRMVLAFQVQIDDQAGRMCSALGSFANALGGNAGGNAGAGATQPGATTPPGGTTQPGGAAGGGTQTSGCPRPQIWSLVPVSSGLVQALFGGGAATPPVEGQKPAARFGDFDGSFDAKISDEGTKVNAQLDGLSTSGRLGVQVEALLRLTCDARWDGLFDREDAQGQRYTRPDLVIHLRDWANDAASASALRASFPGGGACNVVVDQNPFENGFQDKNYPYDRGPDRYRAKSARLDSMDELYLVAGVSDAVMAAFGDQLTVYQPREAAINVNTSDPAEELRMARLMADTTGLLVLAGDPTFPARLHKAVSQIRMGGFLTLTPLQFAQLVDGLGVKVKPEYLQQNNQKNPFTDRSVVYRIRAAGGAGDVTRTIDAVVTFDPQQLQGDPQAGKPLPGRLIRWRVE
jgi:general secretion pathway protein K